MKTTYIMYMYNVQNYCILYNNSVHPVDTIWVAPMWVDITLIWTHQTSLTSPLCIEVYQARKVRGPVLVG
jgi:hypothetical protein